jgi:hypothetical protein
MLEKIYKSMRYKSTSTEVNSSSKHNIKGKTTTLYEEEIILADLKRSLTDF